MGWCSPTCERRTRRVRLLAEAAAEWERLTAAHHGTPYCYQQLGCRRPECLEAAYLGPRVLP